MEDNSKFKIETATPRTLLNLLVGILLFLCLLYSLVVYGLFEYPLPWKVVDPTDPRFNVSNLHFTDYKDRTELGAAMRELFPPGTSKAIVDDTLAKADVTSVKVSAGPKGPQNVYHYSYRNLRSLVLEIISLRPAGDSSWKIGVQYDENDTVVQIVGIGS